MKTYSLTVSSPAGDLFRGDVVMLSLRAEMGDLAVMAGHVPFVTAVRPCDCHIELEDGTVKVGHTDGGILTVGKEKVTLLSGSFSFLET